MSEIFKLNESLLDDLNYFHISDFQIQDNYSTSEKTFIIEFYVEKIITNDYEEELELYLEGKIFLKYDKNNNNNFKSHNIVFYNECRFTNISNELEGVADIDDDYFSLDEVNLEESDAIFEITIIKDEILECIDKNAKNLIIF